MSDVDRIAEVVEADGSEVVAKPLGVKAFEKIAKASEEEEAKALEANVTGEEVKGS